jgi:diguanylate cyclase (GGDEF)-like protein/PAS domain S-box-containing protein
MRAGRRGAAGVQPVAAALEESEQQLRAVVVSAPMVLFGLDRRGVFTLWEGRGLDAIGWRAGEVVGRSVRELCTDVPQALEDARRALAGEAFSAPLDLGVAVFEIFWSPVRDAEGRVTGTTGVGIDITARWRSEQQLAHLASHDRLTGLPNLAGFEARLGERVAAGGRGLVLHLDLDDFATVSLTLGREVGDQLLCEVARRLRDAVPEDVVLARESGDEFLAMVDVGQGDAKAAGERVAGDLLRALAAPLRVADADVQLGATIASAPSPTTPPRAACPSRPARRRSSARSSRSRASCDSRRWSRASRRRSSGASCSGGAAVAARDSTSAAP